MLRALPLLLTACASLPVDGTWDVPSPDVVSDDCGLYRNQAPPPSVAVMTHESPERFTLVLDSSDPVTCTRQGPAFTCEPVLTTLTWGDSTAQNEVRLTGTFLDAFHAAGHISAEATCEGRACAIFTFSGIELPCLTELDWTASFRG